MSGLLACIGYLVPYIFLPDRAVDMGLTVSEGAWLIEVLGIANTIARCVVGFLSDYLSTCACLNRTMLYCTAQTLAGALTAACVVLCDFLCKPIKRLGDCKLRWMREKGEDYRHYSLSSKSIDKLLNYEAVTYA
jgi:MFS family permease